MKVEVIIGILCITIIVIVALGMGYDGAMASSGFALIGALLGWQGKKAADRRGKNTEAVEAALKKLGYNEESVADVVQKMKERRK